MGSGINHFEHFDARLKSTLRSSIPQKLHQEATIKHATSIKWLALHKFSFDEAFF